MSNEEKRKEFIISSNNNNENYSINIYLEQDIIRIETIELNYDSNSNNKFLNKLSLNDWKNLNKFYSSFSNVKEIFKLIDEMENDNFSIIKNENFLILKITFEDKYRSYPALIRLKEDKSNKKDEMNINIIEENVILRNDKKDLEKRIEILEDEINKIKYSLPFNLFDNSLYVLEKVYNKLDPVETISKREDLGLINSGIRRLYKKNIKDCSLVYIFAKGSDNNLYKFQEIFKKLENLLIIIKTMNNRTFGAFYTKSNNSYFQPTPFLINTQQICSFIFSLDNKRIYYTDLFYRDSYEKPNFTINYDVNNLCFKGIEYKGNNYSNKNGEGNLLAPSKSIINNQYQDGGNFEAVSTCEGGSVFGAAVDLGTVAYSRAYETGTIVEFGASAVGPPIVDCDITKNIFVLSGVKEFIVSNLEIFDVKF